MVKNRNIIFIIRNLCDMCSRHYSYKNNYNCGRAHPMGHPNPNGIKRHFHQMSHFITMFLYSFFSNIHVRSAQTYLQRINGYQFINNTSFQIIRICERNIDTCVHCNLLFKLKAVNVMFLYWMLFTLR